MSTAPLRVDQAALAPFVQALFAAAGASPLQASGVTRAVIDASSRGVDSHGVRLVPDYLDMLAGGQVDGRAEPTVEAVAPAAVRVDAGNGFGHTASFAAIEAGVALARQTGIAAAVVTRSGHHGATGVYARAAALAGCAALAMTHADKAVIPHGGVQPFFGTNPLAFGYPQPGEPLLIDMATSAMPLNKILLHRALGKRLPPGVAADAAGTPTEDAGAAHWGMPLGADVGYKGMALAMIIDVLCATLAGMPYGAAMPPLFGPDHGRPVPIGHLFLLFDPSRFGDADATTGLVAAMIDDLRRAPARAGHTVQAPGDPELAYAADRARHGITVDPVTWAAFARHGQRLGVPLPAVRA